MVKRAPYIVVFLLVLLAVANPVAVPVFEEGSRALALLTASPATALRQASTISAPLGVGALGRVDPSSKVRRIAPPSTVSVNRVHRLLVEEGEFVSAGQLLAEFADADQRRAAVAEAE